MANILGFVGVGVSLAALVCSILAMALNLWQTVELGSVKLEIGLWKYCTDTSGTKACVDIDDQVDSKTELRTIRAMVLIAMLCLLATAICAILKLVVMKDNKMLSFVAGGVAILAGLCLMIAMAIYVDEYDTEKANYGAAFALDIVAWLMAWVAGALIIAGEVMSKEQVFIKAARSYDTKIYNGCKIV